eukprot:3941520-Rhodomonas_salina.1
MALLNDDSDSDSHGDRVPGPVTEHSDTDHDDSRTSQHDNADATRRSQRCPTRASSSSAAKTAGSEPATELARGFG